MDASVILALQIMSAQTMQPSEADQSSPCLPQKGGGLEIATQAQGTRYPGEEGPLSIGTLLFGSKGRGHRASDLS